jgi:hypothetical protein
MGFENLPELTEEQIRDIAFVKPRKSQLPVVEDAELTRNNGHTTRMVYAVGRGKIGGQEMVFFGREYKIVRYLGRDVKQRVTNADGWEIVGSCFNGVEYKTINSYSSRQNP